MKLVSESKAITYTTSAYVCMKVLHFKTMKHTDEKESTP
jgi:hypothetical protein